jgi:hypothetical protein
MYKLLVTDVDGTLLDHNSSLSELNKRAIEDCLKSGINVVIATGKSFHSISYLVDYFDLSLPQITLGGAVLITPKMEIIDIIRIPVKFYYEIISKVRNMGYEPVVATQEGSIYYQEYLPTMKYIMDVGEKLIKVKNLLSDEYAKKAVSISIPIPEEDPLDAYIRKEFGSRMQVVRSGKYFFDILNIKALKGNALKKLINFLGIKKEEVVAFGDSHNDISLFKEAGLKIAVKNSYPELIKISDIVTEENYKSGLGKAIYKYVLKSKEPDLTKKLHFYSF